MREQGESWKAKPYEERLALCQAYGPLELNGLTYPPNIEECLETGYKCWGDAETIELSGERADDAVR